MSYAYAQVNLTGDGVEIVMPEPQSLNWLLEEIMHAGHGLDLKNCHYHWRDKNTPVACQIQISKGNSTITEYAWILEIFLQGGWEPFAVSGDYRVHFRC